MTRTEEQALTLPGPIGDLEARWIAPQGTQTVVILCHPHPLYGGQMDNKIITTLARACQKCGIGTLRFNFRGVGHSEGEFAHGVGERMDLEAVCMWLKREKPDFVQAIAGFSFGSAIAVAGALKHPFEWLITVAPPVGMEYWPTLPKHAAWYEAWLMIQGDQDDVVSPESVKAYWEDHLQKQPTLEWVEGVGHFFHGELVRLRQIVEAWLTNSQKKTESS